MQLTKVIVNLYHSDAGIFRVSTYTVKYIQNNSFKTTIGNEIEDDDIAVIPLISCDTDDAQNYGHEDYICCCCNEIYQGILHQISQLR